MIPDWNLTKRLFKLAKKYCRHDRSPTYTVIAAWVDKNNQILTARTNHLVAGQIFGTHAEERCMCCRQQGDRLVVVRFNVRNIKNNICKPAMAKPCEDCQKVVVNADVWYTDWDGSWKRS